MIKKLIITLLLLITLVGCSNKGEYIPTAIITNLEYEQLEEQLKFQIDISDKSNTIKEAYVEIYKNNELQEKQDYNKDKKQYIFDNVENDENYFISVKAQYTLNSITVDDKEICYYNITNIISTQQPYFISKTLEYDGESHSIYLDNIDTNKYNVSYSGNGVSEIGVHKVIATVTLDDIVIETYEAFIVITQSTPQLAVYDQTVFYTGEEIEIQYELTPTVDIDITYNNETTPPIEVGVYVVVLTTIETEQQKEITKTVKLEIVKASIEIKTTNKVVKYNGDVQEVQVVTNIECESTIQYFQNDVEVTPINAGVYDVIITIQDTNNYNGLIKLITLTIIDEESVDVEGDLIISQLSYQDDNDLVIEIFNPTSSAIDLSNYKILLGLLTNNKVISFENVLIEPYKTYTIASINTNYTNIKFNQYSSYLVYDSNISLLKENEVIDQVLLTQKTNIIRNENIGIPNSSYKSDEWTTTILSSTFNFHEYDYSNLLEESYLQIYFYYSNVINYGQSLDFNNYIYVFDEKIGRIYITTEMYENSVDVYELGTQEITFTINSSTNNERIFTIQFIVKDIEGPIFTITSDTLTFAKNTEIDFESLVSVIDNYDESIQFTVDTTNVDTTSPGAYKILYKAIDSSNNETVFSLYIFIE